jgi:site-specific DNA-methyltransferase (adenine-specific)
MAELIWKGKWESTQSPILPATDKHLETIVYFHGMLESQGVETEQPPTDWYNRLIRGERREVLVSLLGEFAGKVNLVYIDPPFMTGRDFTSGAQVAYSDKWNNDLDGYLPWLYETFVLLHALLAQTGSLYVHLDWRVVHYAKLMLDEVFGFSPNAEGPGFKSEIIWHYRSGGRAQKWYARKHDTILFYTKSADYCFHPERIGERRGAQKRNHMRKVQAVDGRITWTIRSAGRLYTYDEDSLMTPADVWNDISHLHQKDPERNGYATQKPEALLQRILLASSEADDLVLDCFCGSGVMPVVAEQLGRRWIAADMSSLAIQLTRERLIAREQLRPFVMQQIEA